ncbi:MAG: LpxD N-terminal domain-containing protein [Flavobacteriales bacterium]
MKLNPPQTIASIAALIHCAFEGDASFAVSGINEIHKVGPGDLVFVDHPKYYDKALQSAATTILINQKVNCPEGKALIFSDDPCRDYNFLTRHFSPWKMTEGNRGDDVKIGAACAIHPSVVMGNHITIGERCIIHPGVVLYDNVHIGNDCIIHANAVLGSDAFYYKARPEGREKMHSCGSVVLGDHVEIGAACTIDKGVSGETQIGAHSKLDNHVHVGHDTVIGKHCLFAAQVGIAGCVIIEDNVTLWGQVGVVSGVTLRKGSVAFGQSGVGNDLDEGKSYLGSPAEEARQKWRELARLKQLVAKADK